MAPHTTWHTLIIIAHAHAQAEKEEQDAKENFESSVDETAVAFKKLLGNDQKYLTEELCMGYLDAMEKYLLAGQEKVNELVDELNQIRPGLADAVRCVSCRVSCVSCVRMRVCRACRACADGEGGAHTEQAERAAFDEDGGHQGLHGQDAKDPGQPAEGKGEGKGHGQGNLRPRYARGV
jgi:hypothetical protein